MKHYSVYKSFQADRSERSGYIATYECYLGKQLCFRCDFGSKFTLPEPGVIENLKTREQVHYRVTKKTGEPQVDFHLNDQLVLRRKGSKVWNEDERCMAQIKDRSSLAKSILRNALGGNASQFYWLDPDTQEIMAAMVDHKPKKRFPWPLSIIEAIVKAVLPGPRKPRFHFYVKNSSVEDVYIFAISMMIEATLNLTL